MSERKYATEKVDQDGNLEVRVDHDYPGELVLRIEMYGPRGAWIYFFENGDLIKRIRASTVGGTVQYPTFSRDKK